MKCNVIPSSLHFLEFRFSERGVIEQWSLELERATCFKAMGETNVTAVVYNNVTRNDDIQITFYVTVNSNERKHLHGEGLSLSLSLPPSWLSHSIV